MQSHNPRNINWNWINFIYFFLCFTLYFLLLNVHVDSPVHKLSRTQVITSDKDVMVFERSSTSHPLPLCSAMQLGNLNIDSRNSMQNQDLSFIWSPFNLIHLKYCALDKAFERINTQILCLCHKKIVSFPCATFSLPKMGIYAIKNIQNAFLGHLRTLDICDQNTKKIDLVEIDFGLNFQGCPTCATGEAWKRLNNKKKI